MNFKSYRDLRVWQAAMELAVWVYRISQTFPRSETYGLMAPIRRGAVTIPSRIAEGHTSEDLKDYLYFIGKAQATLADLETQVLLAGRLSYLSDDQVAQSLQQTEALGKQLYALRKGDRHPVPGTRILSTEGGPASMSANRRRFLKSSLAASTLVSMGARTIPGFLSRTAEAAGASRPNDRILVVVQLLGGNDGLNTVVPHGLDGYANARRALRLPAGQLHKITKEIGLHPSMGRMSKLLEDGRLAVVQGVGYPNPDRSHFRSMEIWETARVETGALETGWLGRAIDAAPAKPGEDARALHVGGRSLPLALKAKRTEVPSLESLEQYRLRLEGASGDRRASRDALDHLARIDRGDDPLLGFMRRSTLTAYESSKRLEQVVKPSGGSKYPSFGLARRLELVAQIIKAGFGTRVFYTSLDGFDTHANQLGTHAALLNELSDSVGAFHADLASAGQADRVALMTFSEFGRRVKENASQGTDHGAAAPVFLVGPVAKPGLVGAHPSLESLDDGDLIHHTDFRRVYAALLERWLGCPSALVLGTGFEPVELFGKKA
jgi:four helix bundle protein